MISFENFKKAYTSDLEEIVRNTNHEISKSDIQKIKEFNEKFLIKYEKILELYIFFLNDFIQQSFERTGEFTLGDYTYNKSHSEREILENYIEDNYFITCKELHMPFASIDRKALQNILSWKKLQTMYSDGISNIEKLTLQEMKDLYKKVDIYRYSYISGGEPFTWLQDEMHLMSSLNVNIKYMESKSKLIPYSLVKNHRSCESLRYMLIYSENWESKTTKEKENIIEEIDQGEIWLDFLNIIQQGLDIFLKDEKECREFTGMYVDYLLSKNLEYRLEEFAKLDMKINPNSLNYEQVERNLVSIKENIINHLLSNRGLIDIFSDKDNEKINAMWSLEGDFKRAENMCVAKAVSIAYPKRYDYSVTEKDQYDSIVFPKEELLKDLPIGHTFEKGFINNFLLKITSQNDNKKEQICEDIFITIKKGFIKVVIFKDDETGKAKYNVVEIKDLLLHTFKNLSEEKNGIDRINDFLKQGLREIALKKELSLIKNESVAPKRKKI